WGQRLRKIIGGVPILPHSAGAKKDLEQGIPGLMIQLDQGLWRFPYPPGGWHHENIEVFLNEAEAFGWNAGRLESVGQHDDTVLAFFHAAWGCERLMVEG